MSVRTTTTDTRRPATEGGRHEFFHPESALWWLYCLAVGIGGAGVVLQVSMSFNPVKETLLTIAPIFVVTLLLFAALVLLADPYRARRPWVLMLAVVFGATVPTYLAIHGNDKIFRIVVQLLPEGVGADWNAAVAGPSTEEWGKMLGTVLIMLIASSTLRRPMHGFLVGAFVGLGFQIFENVSYAANSAGSDANSDFMGAFGVTLMRSAIGISSHWLYTAISGVGVAYLLGRTLRDLGMTRRILMFVGYFVLAWGLHFLWNSPTGEGAVAALAMPLKVILALVVLVLVARVAWKEERAYLAGAQERQSDLPDEPVREAIGTRSERRKGLKAVRRAEGRGAVKRLKRERARYLDRLQASDLDLRSAPEELSAARA